MYEAMVAQKGAMLLGGWRDIVAHLSRTYLSPAKESFLNDTVQWVENERCTRGGDYALRDTRLKIAFGEVMESPFLARKGNKSVVDRAAEGVEDMGTFEDLVGGTSGSAAGRGGNKDADSDDDDEDDDEGAAEG